MRLSILLIMALLGAATLGFAGNWHVEGNLACQDCHLQHSTELGEPLPGGPHSYLLLKSSINELCLSCHDGSDPTAPDVQTPVQMYQSTSSGESAGGYFALTGVKNHAGHDIGVAMTVPLQAAATIVDLNCASCHAVHGNSNYRNLLYDPAGTGDSAVLVENSDVFTALLPDVPPTISGTVAAYERANVAYKQSYANWCATCHDQLATNAGALPPAHFNAHPSDVAFDDFPGEGHADIDHWISGLGEGFILEGAQVSYGIPRVPFESPGATDFVSAAEVASSNEVFCASCHKGHGSENTASLRWPYMEGGNLYLAGCQQCHNQ